MISKAIKLPLQLLKSASTNSCISLTQAAQFSTTHQKTQQSNQSNKNNIKKQYIPLRPLKKQVTTLFVDKNFINKGQTPSKPKLLPYLLPSLAISIHNILTQWTLITSTGMVVAFSLGFFVHTLKALYLDRSTMKLECNRDMTKFYIEIVQGIHSTRIKQEYPQHEAEIVQMDEDELNALFKENEQKTQTTENINAKQKQLADKKQSKKQWNKIIELLFKKYKTRKFQLNAEQTQFILSSEYDHQIKQNEKFVDSKQNQSLEGKLALSNVYPFLIVKTQFKNIKGKPINLTISLDDNADHKYQDYLIALGQGNKIKTEV